MDEDAAVKCPVPQGRPDPSGLIVVRVLGSAAGMNKFGAFFLLNLCGPTKALTDPSLGWKLLPYCNRFPHLSCSMDDSRAH